MKKETANKNIAFAAPKGKINFSFDTDGTTIILQFSDNTIKKIKKISEEESTHYEEYGAYELLGSKKFPPDVSIAICRMINLCHDDFLEKTCAYRQNEYEFIFYKEKK
jgi:hypothetical protein